MRPPCRFIFTDDDAGLIDLSTLQVTDLPLWDPFSQGLQLRFKTRNNARVMVRPLTTCNVRFVADQDPETPGILPKPEEVFLDDEHYNKWKVVGLLVLELVIATKTLSTLAPGLLVKPNRIWLGPVRLPKEFLFDSLIKKDRLARAVVDTLHPSDDPAKEFRWQQHAISKFLAGVYEPIVALHPTDPTQDDAVRMPMPMVGFDAPTGNHTLIIHAANSAKPEDATDLEWDPPGRTREQRETARLNPTHPRNGAIPARIVFQELRTKLVPAETAEAKAVRDKVVEPPAASEPRSYYPIRFTRSYQFPTTNPYDMSIYFPQQTVVFRNSAGAELRRQKLPAHGVLWLEGSFFKNVSTGTKIELEGNMRWLQWAADVFRHKGEQTPVPMSTDERNPQHIVLRLPMSKAMMEDDSRPRGNRQTACTFFSIRRTVRALLDNRICGGRLSKEVNEGLKTRQETRALFTNTGIPASAVANNRPDTSLDAGDGVRALTPLLITLFNEDCDQHEIPGVPPPSGAEIWKKGRAAAYLWQSAQDVIKDPKIVRNFSDEDMGRGGAGAIVMLGLGEYHCNEIPPEDTSLERQYIDDMVGIMIDGNLNPGATTQLWRDVTFYRSMMKRTVNIQEPPAIGHSPVFARYDPESGNGNGTITGISIIDQTGQHTNRVINVGTPPTRQFSDGLVWIAANFTE